MLFWNFHYFDDDFLSLFIERALQKSKGEKETLDKEISEAEETLRELKEAYEKVKKLLIIIIIIIIIYYLYGANYMWI